MVLVKKESFSCLYSLIGIYIELFCVALIVKQPLFVFLLLEVTAAELAYNIFSFLFFSLPPLLNNIYSYFIIFIFYSKLLFIFIIIDIIIK